MPVKSVIFTFICDNLKGSIVGLQVASEKKMIGSSAGAYAVSFALFTYFVMVKMKKKYQFLLDLFCCNNQGLYPVD